MFSSKLRWPLEEDPGACEEGEKWWCLVTAGQCGEVGSCVHFTPFLQPCDWCCFHWTLCWDFWHNPHSTCCIHWGYPLLAVFHPTAVLQQDREFCSISSQPTYPSNKFSPQSKRERLFHSNCLLNEWMNGLSSPACSLRLAISKLLF